MSYGKLVRDNIPNLIRSNGEEPIIRTLSSDEYEIELNKKLLEECQEVIDSDDQHIIEELADVLEVLISLGKLSGKSLTDIITVCENKRLLRGSFDQMIYLERVISKEDHTKK